ncbi:hypothetical protein MF672_024970 [Actinomadura sp. ATCC 31491]|uniref:Lipoprotein n=1 Tax=Actinomadura luzonensis TaxID=2805427 RepID=A0ABT0FXN3_9ACTN|nr:hypothetical protein [Actinomadura luzonensis]MCK2217019.1 hypothetical protein [Actinomadura luzonensis]
MRSRYLSVVAAALLLASAACTSEAAPALRSPGPAATGAAAAAPCTPARVVDAEPPVWANAGFTPGTKVRYAASESGDMLAVLFGYPLYSPPLPDRANKVLWRSRAPLVPSDPLLIEARLGGTGPPTRIKVLGGPGPSYVDVPSPGCWRLKLTWSSRTDSIDLEYAGR